MSKAISFYDAFFEGSGGQEFGNGPVSQFFLIVALSPFLVIMAEVWVVMKILSPIMCLPRLNEYKSCLEDPEGALGFSTPRAMKKNLSPSQGASCLEPCYSDFNDCMESSDNFTEESQCEEEKTMCAQQCEGKFN